MPLPHHVLEQLESLRQQILQHPHGVVPFVGSGLSRSARTPGVGSGLPSWEEMLRSLLRRVKPASVVGKVETQLATQRLVEAATTLAEHLKRPIISGYIQQTFSAPKSERPPVYDRVARLPCIRFVTTNYDPWLRNALREFDSADRGEVEDANPDQLERLLAFLPSRQSFVFHAHYDARDPSKCVFAQADYDRLLNQTPGYIDFLKALAAESTFLFLGYSVRDADLCYVLNHWREIIGEDSAPRHYLLDIDISDEDKDSLIALGISPIDYHNPRGHLLLAEILAHLHDDGSDWPPPPESAGQAQWKVTLGVVFLAASFAFLTYRVSTATPSWASVYVFMQGVLIPLDMIHSIIIARNPRGIVVRPGVSSIGVVLHFFKLGFAALNKSKTLVAICSLLFVGAGIASDSSALAHPTNQVLIWSLSWCFCVSAYVIATRHTVVCIHGSSAHRNRKNLVWWLIDNVLTLLMYGLGLVGFLLLMYKYEDRPAVQTGSLAVYSASAFLFVLLMARLTSWAVLRAK